MPIYNGYPQVYYPQQPQGQLEQLRATQYQPQPVMMPTMQGQAAPTDSGFIWVQGEAALQVLNVPILAVEAEILSGNETDFVLVHFPVVLLHI